MTDLDLSKIKEKFTKLMEMVDDLSKDILSLPDKIEAEPKEK